MVKDHIAEDQMDYTFFLGGHTDRNLSSDQEPSKGIYRFTMSGEGKVAGPAVLAAEQPSPVDFLLSEDHTRLYVSSEPAGPGSGAIYSYQLDPDTGELSGQTCLKAPGGGISRILIDPARRNLMALSYQDASIQVYPLDEEGALTPMFCLRHHIGSGPNLKKQDKAHVACAVYTPDGHHAAVCDLGMDAILVYSQIAETGKLHRALELNFHMPPESGPKDMVFSHDGHFAFVLCELSSEVAVLKWDLSTGFKLLSMTGTQSPEFQSPNNSPSCLTLTRSGRFLYVSNCGEDSIALFSVDTEHGSIQRVKNFSTRGWYPKTLLLTHDEKFLLAPNEMSDNLVVFRRDPDSGLLTLTDEADLIQKPLRLIEVSNSQPK